MNYRLKASAVAAFAFGLLASSAEATVAYTNEWFSVDVSSLTPGNIVVGAAGANGSWTAVPAAGDAVVVNEKIAIDTDLNAPLTYAPTTAGTEPISRISTKLLITLSSELPAASEITGAKTALCVCTNGAGAVKWFALVGGGWSELSGTPATNKNYEVVLESNSDTHEIRYLARNLTDSETAFTELTSGWVANSASTAAISAVSFAGATTLDDFFGEQVVGPKDEGSDVVLPVATTGDHAEVVAAANITKAWIAANMNITVSDAATLALAADKINTVPDNGNGMTYWESYVLGLTPSDTSSKPIVQPVQNADVTKVSFKLGNVEVKSAAGVPVSYRVNSYSNAACTSGLQEGVFVGADETAESPDTLPTTAGARYYKLEIRFSAAD